MSGNNVLVTNYDVVNFVGDRFYHSCYQHPLSFLQGAIQKFYLSLSAKDFDDRERCLKLQSYNKFIHSHADCVKKSEYAVFVQFYFYANFLDKPRSASNCKHSFVENMNIINQLIPKFLKNNSFGFEVSLMVSQARFTFRADPRSLSNFIKRQSHGLIKLMNWIIFQNMIFM